MDEPESAAQDSNGTVDGSGEAPDAATPWVAEPSGSRVAEGHPQATGPHDPPVEGGGEPTPVEPPEMQSVVAVPEAHVTVAVEESPPVLIDAEPVAGPDAHVTVAVEESPPVLIDAEPVAGPPAPPPGFLLGSEVAISARLRQPAFDLQLSLLEQRAVLKKKVYLAVIVIASVLLAGMIAGAVLGLFV